MPDGRSLRPTCPETNFTLNDAGTMCLRPSETPTPVGYAPSMTSTSPTTLTNTGVRSNGELGDHGSGTVEILGKPNLQQGESAEVAAEDNKLREAKTQALKNACDGAFDYAPAAHSCSHAVWFVISKLINSNEPWRDANDLIEHMTQSEDWREVNVEEAWKLANEGIVVVGGKSDVHNGHVMLVYPGSKILGGGYIYTLKNRVTGKVEQYTMRSHGLLPRCLSRSMGTWPGAVSKGDKNVFDPFGNEAAFRQVKFWTMDKP
jgi:hypothetical protein